MFNDALYIDWSLPGECNLGRERMDMEPQAGYARCWRHLLDLNRSAYTVRFHGAEPAAQPYFYELFRSMAMSGLNVRFVLDIGDLHALDFYKRLLADIEKERVCVNLNVRPECTELRQLLLMLAVVVEGGQFCRLILSHAQSEKTRLLCKKIVEFRKTLPFSLEISSYPEEDIWRSDILRHYTAIRKPPLAMPDWSCRHSPEMIQNAYYCLGVNAAHVTPDGELTLGLERDDLPFQPQVVKNARLLPGFPAPPSFYDEAAARNWLFAAGMRKTSEPPAMKVDAAANAAPLPDTDGLFKTLPDGIAIEELKLLLPDEFWLNDPLAAVALVLRACNKFDGDKYLQTYPDVREAGCDPLKHYILHGYAESRMFFVRDYNRNTMQHGPDRIGAELSPRLSLDELLGILNSYDVISFDIFDTALLRTVEFPENIFDIMALEMRWPDFASARKIAESQARAISEKMNGHREIGIDDIYALMSARFNVDRKWQEREIELEHRCSLPNKFIFELYKRLIACGKSVIFVSDMYLPYSEIERMLRNSGYGAFSRLYVSNAYKLRKGDGSLQEKVKKDYQGKKIIHIGDNKSTDKEKFEESGIPAIWNPDCRLMTRPPYLNNLAGHLCRAVLNNAMNTGQWKHGLHYTHGFRAGGILTAGYCLFINKIAKDTGTEKILFCARDGYIIQRVYADFWREVDNAYLEISRYAILNLSPERYAHDLLSRFIFRYWDQNNGRMTLEQLLRGMGYDFLVPCLENHDLSRFRLCATVSKEVFTDFFLSQIQILKEHAQDSINAAKFYFRQLIGNAKSALVVDIGWSGTCISAFEYFVRHEISDDIKINGVLMCAADSRKMANQVIGGSIYPYISAPTINSDLHTRMKGGNKEANIDMVHMPLEYMFTNTEASLLAYKLAADNALTFVRDKNTPPNCDEIRKMQSGIHEFNKMFAHYLEKFNIRSRHAPDIAVPPYAAFIAFKQCIEDTGYIYAVYKNFLYDACTLPGVSQPYRTRFAALFRAADATGTIAAAKGNRILFISPELTYTGTPRSLLRVCRVARDLGYEPVVWSQSDGPFRQEFEDENMSVSIVTEGQISQKKYVDIIKSCGLAFCNTIVTDGYVRFISRYIPTIWFIREASNIPEFCRNNPQRLELLKSYDKIFCVSEYAADALGKYTGIAPRVLHNCVEDETRWAENHRPGSGDTVKFAQFGTMEYRKGYDILIAAYKKMPEAYRQCCELYFAGGFINSGTPYCDYIFSEMADIPQIHYLGVVSGEEDKIRTLSQMDVIVVASRDESCSLVALEGAMLSKPLIVTANVGAKYMVDANNGLVVPSGNVEAMKQALMRMIDCKGHLQAMGMASRRHYEKRASMEGHKTALARLFQAYCLKKAEKAESSRDMAEENEVLISLTSHPGRIGFVAECIKSLIAQDYRNRKIILWLAREEFPELDHGLPYALNGMQASGDLEIRWVGDDLKPHKKYFYACQEFADRPVITVDDDVIYEPRMVSELVKSYKKFPDCVSCHRANLISLKPDRTFRPYNSWIMGYTLLRDTPSYQLLPTGVGGILYPPGILPHETFDPVAIKKLCLYCDDLWLKIMCVLNGVRSVLVDSPCRETLIENSQDVALWRENVKRNANDIALENISRHLQNKGNCFNEIMEKIRRDRFC